MSNRRNSFSKSFEGLILREKKSRPRKSVVERSSAQLHGRLVRASDHGLRPKTRPHSRKSTDRNKNQSKGRPSGKQVWPLSSDEASSADWNEVTQIESPLPSRNRRRSLRSARRSVPPSHGEETTQTTEDWTRSLVELRKHRIRSNPTLLNSATRKWLNEQHQALESASLPVLKKCMLAVASASYVFRHCRDDFRKSEYRGRYWSWCETFLRLIDYSISHGTDSLTQMDAQVPASLKSFVLNAHTQKENGTLSSQKEQMLIAVGIPLREGVLSEGKRHKSLLSISTDDQSSSADDDRDNMGGSALVARKTRRKLISRRSTRKRRRSPAAQSSFRPVRTRGRQSKPHSSAFDSGYSGVVDSENGRPSLLDWARHIVELRAYFEEGKGYEIPPDRPYLSIWMNAEMARSVAGTLPAICCCILRVTEVTDSVDDTVYISEECEKWCKSYVEYLDFALENGEFGHDIHKASSSVTDFMYDCRQNLIEYTLSEERSALLRAVDHKWLESKLLDLSIKRNQAKLGAAQRKQRETEDPIERVEETVLDSWTRYDTKQVDQRKLETQSKRKRPKIGKECQAMLSEMIKGFVGETIEGRKRTATEKKAEEWVSRTGANALNTYAQKWFRDLTSDLNE
ncbi:hypothetical protein BWQ96_06562 [Gracilariopsis chorda]|uniref:Uncharacterized protein n=1 Tax=Gracilariopsis chorda TaxID=448386 RepID=A0A2V3INM6_9FLOR|nr:hypothetical protein BWQ96_06562 [Gracilariopsis chorda]|eukprot:PXF43657.1 hypothetical protein BWQ96_06562 [Gracilariopsis chorda]